MKIELTKEEASNLLGLVDVAVKAMGLSNNGQIAQLALYFQAKLTQAAAEEDTNEEVSA